MNKKDKCIRCSKETEYGINDSIDIRYNYVEGAGQLCPKCYNYLYQKNSEDKSDDGDIYINNNFSLN